ncbi:hypothetical protein CTheo_6727 [Ceratobasidium theobromae]|uniref:Uncharacterized protein n=1 Tax=Ceratobasidium theobromae TaxID=1582974 RepID=A0A5N5QDK0_9AGAM|nr:hypothetical protein CTheo_6727 [Ceratobasidium theobromae]
MGRKKGGKNPEGHRAGGARSGAGRPRKAGPLTLKDSVRMSQPAVYIRRDAIHPALRPFVELPATCVLRCSKCGHDDNSCLLVSEPADENPPATSSLVSRSQSPRPDEAVSFEQRRSDTVISPLFTPPQSISSVASSSVEPEHALAEESPAVHAESLLLLGTPVPTPTASVPAHQSYDIEPQELTHANIIPSTHLDQQLTYTQPCFSDFLPPNGHEAHPVEQFTDSENFRMYNQQPDAHFPTTPQSFQPGPSESSPTQVFYPPRPQPQQPEYPQPQPQAFYGSNTSFPPGPGPDMYISLPPQHAHIKPGPAAWRHAPHSTSLPPVTVLSPNHTHPQLDPSGPVQFLPTGQHTQRRRRRCVVCIGAGRGEEADRCCGRGNRHLCPWYQRHGSPDNIMEIRNAKDLRPTTST